ncbi:MAG TPA: RNA polymerase sigma factor [Candidatus Acidoferrales bacterium]|nr:RNA polymerase sigma factor [Candidatus Acidoferrales bacterium]
MDALVGTYPEAVVILDPSLEREFEERLADSSALAFRVALGVLRNRDDAEDVAQEAFLRAYQSFARLRDRERFRAWLARITWRLALDRIRSTRRREARETVVMMEDLNSPQRTVEDVRASREFEQRLARALDALPEKLRVVLVLSAIEGHDVSEVSRLLDVAEGTVKSRLFHARKKLAEMLR